MEKREKTKKIINEKGDNTKEIERLIRDANNIQSNKISRNKFNQSGER